MWVSPADRGNPNASPGDGWSYSTDLGRWVPVQQNMQSLFPGGIFSMSTNDNYVKNMTQSKKMLQVVAQDADISAYLPPMVRSVIQSNATLGFNGIGPVGPNSLPMYAGRYI